jgi:hypothetical protein
MPDAARRKRAVVRTTFTVDQPACANAPARGVAPTCHRRMRPPTIEGIRFAPKRSLPARRSAATSIRAMTPVESKADMTAYLISLALAGLVVIALCEAFE